MGEVFMRGRNAGWRLLIIGAAASTALAIGCSSSTPKPKAVEVAPARHEAPADNDRKVPAPAEIRSIDLREGAPEVYLDVEASAPLVWTSFRNAQGQVVVELPNSVPGARVADLSPREGLISSLKVERQNDGSRPLTRLVVTSRQEVEHSITADGAKLRVQLLPVDGDRTASAHASGAPETPAAAPDLVAEKPATLTYEPVAPVAPASPGAAGSPESPAAPIVEKPAEKPVEKPSALAVAVPAVPAGTPDEPAVAPAPAGKLASRLSGIEVVSTSGPVLRIEGDGDFPYATFALANPPRFVVDLNGVVNRAPRPVVAVQSGAVQRVRVAQFKPAPQPVARVVFDLAHGAVPRIERTSHSLTLHFDETAAASAAAPPAALAPSAPPAPATAVKTASAPAIPPPPAPIAPMATAEIAEATPPPPAPRVHRETAPASSAPSSPSASSTQSTQSTPKPLATATKASSSRKDSVEQATLQSEDAPVTPPPPPPPPPAAKLPVPVVENKGPAAGAGRASDLQLTRKAGAAGITAATGGPGGSPVQSFASQDVGTAGERKYVGEPIDLKLRNADVTEVLRNFAQISGLNIVVQPGVTGTVTAEMENVPWDQALEEILKINKLGFELDGNVMRIAPTSVLREEAQERQELAAARALAIPLRTVMRRLSYADAQQVSALLRSGQAGLLSQRGSVIVDNRTNTLIIKELPSYLDTVIAVIEQLDTPEPQVMIEARIIETTRQFSRDLGIRWNFNAIADAAHGNTTGLIFPNNGSLTGAVDVGGQTGDVLNLKLGNVLNTFSLDVALQAAENEGLIHILSAPKVATLNNQRAEIQSGLQIPIQTIANNTVTVQFVNATLRLAVTPQVTAEGTVLMDIDISKREPLSAFLVPGATNAPISTKDAKTRLVVRDGGTAVIGGIYKVTNQEAQDRIPVLANIPILGNLFKNKSVSDTNDELLIFITPRVIKI